MASIPVDFKGAATPLSTTDIRDEAALLQCKIAIIHAFSDLESGGSSGFEPDGKPQALFEAKAFHNRTGGKYDHVAPNISSPFWNRALYGAGGSHQWDRFNVAYKLDPEAAMLSMSIGRFQAMGFNFHICGFNSVQDMYAAYCDSARAHLDGFAAFIRNAGLLPALRSDPPGFVKLAVGYNGEGERQNGYDQKLEVSFYHFAGLGEGIIPAVGQPAPPPAPPLPPSGIPSRVGNPTIDPPQPKPTPLTRVLFIGESGNDVLRAQQLLARAGLTSVPQTGRFDAATKAVVENFQRAHHLLPDGEIGPLTGSPLGF